MSETVSITGVVENGRLKEGGAVVRHFLNMMEGRKVKVTVQEVKRVRSLSQNAYYWGGVVPVVVQMFAEAGQPVSPEEAHEYLKMNVMKLHKVVMGPDGKPSVIGGSTTDLSTGEFSEKIALIQSWADSFGWHIPSPNEVVEADGTIIVQAPSFQDREEQRRALQDQRGRE